MLICWYDAYFFLKNPQENAYWEKPRLLNLSRTTPVISVIMYVAEVTAFDIAKNKILKKKMPIWHLFNPMLLLKRFAHIFFGTTKLLLMCMAMLIHTKTKRDFFRYLSKNYTSLYNKRERILFINNEWRVNPLPRKYILTQFFSSKYNEYKAHQIATELDNLAIKIERETLNLDVEALVLKDQFGNKKHKVYTNLTNDNNYFGLLTDFKKADSNNYYNREILIDKLFTKKNSTILIAHQNDFDLKSKLYFNENASAIAWWLVFSNPNRLLINKDINSISDYIDNNLNTKQWWRELDNETKFNIIKIITEPWGSTLFNFKLYDYWKE